MPIINNISRIEAVNWKPPVDPDKNIWISIQEPEKPHIQNSILDQIPNLKIRFWDLTAPVQRIELSEYFYPPTEHDAKEIVDFLLTHQGKNVVVNCKAGVSRSSAVSQFCVYYLGYEWHADGYKRAVPNHLLCNMMAEYYEKLKKL
jgi:predicted protein tyrosine phosphatase